MVDVSRSSEPQLGTVLAAGEHHGEVVFPRYKELSLLLLTQLRDTSNEVCDVLS